MKIASKFFGEVIKALQLSLLLLGSAILFIPQCRSGLIPPLFNFVLTIECAWLVYRAWRAGMSKATPEDSVDRIMSNGPITTGWLERASLLAGFLALLILAITSR